MKKRNYKKYTALLLAALMTLNTGITAFAQNHSVNSNNQSVSKTSGSVIVTENGVTINGVYFTKSEFKKLLNQAVEINDSNNGIVQPQMAMAAGVYFIPGVGEVLIAATGVIVLTKKKVAGQLIKIILVMVEERGSKKISQVTE